MILRLKTLLGRYIPLGVAWVYLASYRRRVSIRPLSSEHIEDAALLLTEQFCLREPLCKSLGMSVEKLLPFFREQVIRAAARDLGLVALSPAGDLVGALTMEDHLDPYVPSPHLVTPEFRAIGALLEELKLPDDVAPHKVGEVFNCALAAVKPGFDHIPIMSLLMPATFLHTDPKGYLRGYAKITNPRIIRRMRQTERRFHLGVFSIADEKNDADYPSACFAPLTQFRVALVHWKQSLW